MGFPLGPTLGNIFLCFHEQIWLDNCPVEFKPVIYRRFVDDTFLLFRSKEHIEKFRLYLNCQHPNISGFTCLCQCVFLIICNLSSFSVRNGGKYVLRCFP